MEFTFPAQVVTPHIIAVGDAIAQFGNTVENITEANGNFGEEFINDAIDAGRAISDLLGVCHDYMEEVGPHYVMFKAFFDGLHGVWDEDSSDETQ